MKKGLTFNCTYCGKESYKPPSLLKGQKNLFCSQPCQHEWRTGRKTSKATGLKKECEYCKKEFYAYPYEINTKKYCSKNCKYNFARENGIHAGENCNFWSGGFDQYRGPNWKLQRAKARRRDNHTCQKCGITKKEEGKDLSVHHIVPFRFFKNDYVEANDLKNLITLCSKCHRLEESHWWDNVPKEYQHLVENAKEQDQVTKRVNFYSKEEVEFLKKHYPIHGPRYVAEQLNRPYDSVVDKAKTLKVNKKRTPKKTIPCQADKETSRKV